MKNLPTETSPLRLTDRTMPFSKENLAKLLKSVKRGSQNRVVAVVEFSKKYKKYAKEICRQIEKFVSKTSKDNLKGALFVIDALCTSDRAQRAKEKEKEHGKTDVIEDDGDEQGKPSYIVFRELFNDVDRLKGIFPHIMECPEGDMKYVRKVLDLWSQSRWFSPESQAYISELLNPSGNASAVNDQMADDISFIPPTLRDNEFADPEAFQILDGPHGDASNPFGISSGLFGGIEEDVPEVIQDDISAVVSSAFDYYDDDEDDDDERRLEEQRKQLEEERKRLEQ